MRRSVYALATITSVFFTMSCGKATSLSTTQDIGSTGSEYYQLTDWGANAEGGFSRAVLSIRLHAMLRAAAGVDLCFDEAASSASNGFALYACAKRQRSGLISTPDALFLIPSSDQTKPWLGVVETLEGVQVGTFERYGDSRNVTWYQLDELCSGRFTASCQLVFDQAIDRFVLTLQ